MHRPFFFIYLLKLYQSLTVECEFLKQIYFEEEISYSCRHKKSRNLTC